MVVCDRIRYVKDCWLC